MTASRTGRPELAPHDSSHVDVDVLVVGSGAAGLSAAVFAAKAGYSVLVCEKTDLIGGTTATSGGVAWLPGNHHARELGIEDSQDLARTYLRHELGNLYRADLIDAFLESAPAALDEIEADTSVKFNHLPWSDYHPDAPGALPKGRSVVAQPFDGRILGEDFSLVRPPIHRLTVLGGMMISPDELPDFLSPFGSFRSLGRVVRKLLRHAGDRLRYPRGTDVRNGNALIARLFLSLRDRNVPIWRNASLTELLVEDGVVRGARLSTARRSVTALAKVGVVLATGGFPASAALRESYASDFPHRFTLAAAANTGDGVSAALAVGARVDMDLASPGLWTPASVLREQDGSETPIIYGYLDRGRPGVIAVNTRGERFVNESNSYHDIVMAMYAQGYAAGERFYFICDRRFVRKHGLGLLRPFPMMLNTRPFEKSGYITAAPSLRDLAKKIGIDATGLVDTVQRHNSFCETGVDLDFGKGSNVYNRQWGDHDVHPNPNLAPIEVPDFLALRIEAATLGTTRGLVTDGDARVMNAENEPIPGLYACGNELASAMRGFYPGGGVTIGPAIVFAYRAIAHMRRTRRSDKPLAV